MCINSRIFCHVHILGFSINIAYKMLLFVCFGKEFVPWSVKTAIKNWKSQFFMHSRLHSGELKFLQWMERWKKFIEKLSWFFDWDIISGCITLSKLMHGVFPDNFLWEESGFWNLLILSKYLFFLRINSKTLNFS